MGDLEEASDDPGTLIVLEGFHSRHDGVVALQRPLLELGELSLELPDNFLYVFKPLRGAGNSRTLRVILPDSE